MMAKSKLQKREEALKRQHESFMTQHLPRLNEVATDKPYDAEHHALLYGRAVNAAHAANCDLHGNMLNCNFYRSGNSDNAQYMALNHTLYTLEEMKEITGFDGRSLYKLAYGTPPFVPETTKHYGVSHSPTAEDIIAAGKALGIDVAPNFTREEMSLTSSMASVSEFILTRKI